MRAPNTANTLLKKSGQLNRLTQRCGLLNKMTKLIKTMLVNPLTEHVTVANLNNETLILHVDSPVWANQLRFETLTLIKKIKLASNKHPELRTIRHLRIKISVPIKTNTKPDTTPNQSNNHSTTDRASRILKDISSGINDLEIKGAIKRLSERLKTHNTN